MKKLLKFFFLFLILVSSLSPVCLAEGSAYVAYGDRKSVLPQIYEHVNTVTGVQSPTGRAFSSPGDVFVDKDGFVYVADSGNNRILKLTADGAFIMEISEFGEDALVNPTGVYVDENGRIFVTDTGNYRIAVFDSTGDCISLEGKPESNLLSGLSIYMPEHIVYSSKTEYAYCIAGKQLLSMDENNNFQGYFGAEPVAFSLRNFLIRRFGRKEQIDTLSQNDSVSYRNICMYDGDIYAVSFGRKNNIKVLNGIGKNTYPSGNYGEVIVDTEQNIVLDPELCDIAVEANGNILVSQLNNNRIYGYDLDGNMLFSFGGSGKTSGYFNKISSIAVSGDGRLYVLDGAANNLQILSPTYFTKLIYRGNTAYNAGDYDGALEVWREISTLCPGYLLAHEKTGNILFKKGEYRAAAVEYRNAGKTGGYARVYDKLRTAWIKEHIYLTAVIIIALLAALYLSVTGYRKLFKKLEHNLYYEKQGKYKTFSQLFAVGLFHPIICFDRIKANRERIPLLYCLAIPAAVPFVCVFRIAAGNYAVTGKTLSDASLLYESAVVLVPLALWIFISYLVTSLMSGEATLKETIFAGCISILPWVVFTPILTLLSHLAGASDVIFLAGAQILLLAFAVLNLLSAMSTMNDYSLGKTLLAAIISIFGMIIVCLAALLFSSLLVQTVNQISGFLHELNTMK